MRQRKKRWFAGVVWIVSMLLSACGAEDARETGSTYQLYYLDADKAGLVTEEYHSKIAESYTVDVISDLLQQLKGSGEEGLYTSPVPQKVEVSDFQIKENQLYLYFTASYGNLSGIDEILSRAAIVKTLCQIKDIEYVEFYVEDQPLMLAGKAVGLMSSDNFADDLNEKVTERQRRITLYFAGRDGRRLREIATRMTYRSAEPLAKLLIEKLIQGPQELGSVGADEKAELTATIPTGTTLNSVTIRDNVCYVDFSREFLELLPGVKSDVIIYSVVNTLCELSDVSKVQFSIEGELREKYGETAAFNTPYERNLEYVENLEKGTEQGGKSD